MPAHSGYAAVTSQNGTARGRRRDRWYLTCLALVMKI